MTYLVEKTPYMRLEFARPDGDWEEIDALIDTGFSGGLALPNEYENLFSEDEFFEQRFVLADGSLTTVNTTFTAVGFNKHEKDVAVVFMPSDEALVGTEFLDGAKFCLDLETYTVEFS